MSSGAEQQAARPSDGLPEASLIQHVFDLAQQVAVALGDVDTSKRDR